MFDQPDQSHHAILPRARGQIRAGFAWRDGATRLARLYQAGSAKAILPPAPGCEMVLLNTSGGLTGGDRMQIAVAQDPGTRLTVTTQTAERAYRSTVDPRLNYEQALELAMLVARKRIQLNPPVTT